MDISSDKQRKYHTRKLEHGLEKETLSEKLIAVQNDAIRTKHVKARICKKQENICRLCIDRSEMINHITSECSKLGQKDYKTWYDWMGKVIHWELCKKFRFEHTKKWYMHNPEPVLENEMHKMF